MRRKQCRTCHDRGIGTGFDTIEELEEHVAHAHPPAPTDPFAPQIKWALLQRWEDNQNIVPMDDENQARHYLQQWTQWVKNQYPSSYADKLPLLMSAEIKWEEAKP